MTDLPNDLAALVDAPRVEAAKAAMQAAKVRRGMALMAHTNAKVALTDARDASAAAIAGQGGDPLEAEAALELAQRKANVCAKVAEHSESAIALAEAAFERENGQAHAKVYAELVKRRFQAAADRERAIEEIRAADARHAEITAHMLGLNGKHYQHPVQDGLWNHENRGVARELSIWSEAPELIPQEYRA